MSIKNVAAAVSLALGSVFTLTLSARADIMRRDAQNNIYIYTRTAEAERQIAFADSVQTRKTRASKCGVAKISPNLKYANATQISVSGTASNIASLPTADPGKCVSAGGIYSLENEPTAQRFKDAIGAIYIQGLSPDSEVTIAYPDLPVSRTVKADTCGLIKLRNSERQPITGSTKIQVGSGSELTVSSLTQVVAPSCKRLTPTQSAFMVPLNQADMWTGS